MIFMKQICCETSAKGCVILNTCNGTEIYAVAEMGKSIEGIILLLKNISPDVGEELWNVSSGDEAIRHLFRVASINSHY